MRILVVDDEIDVRDVVINMLKLAGYAVVAAQAGKGLLDELRAERFDLVLTDLAMPDVTGWEVAAWVRRNRPGTPVIAFTGYVEFLRSDRSFENFAGVLTKPLRRIDLVRAIEDAKRKWAG
jgi:CheY-like chemotaxis protein